MISFNGNNLRLAYKSPDSQSANKEHFRILLTGSKVVTSFFNGAGGSLIGYTVLEIKARDSNQMYNR